MSTLAPENLFEVFVSNSILAPLVLGEIMHKRLRTLASLLYYEI